MDWNLPPGTGHYQIGSNEGVYENFDEFRGNQRNDIYSDVNQVFTQNDRMKNFQGVNSGPVLQSKNDPVNVYQSKAFIQNQNYPSVNSLPQSAPQGVNFQHMNPYPSNNHPPRPNPNNNIKISPISKPYNEIKATPATPSGNIFPEIPLPPTPGYINMIQAGPVATNVQQIKPVQNPNISNPIIPVFADLKPFDPRNPGFSSSLKDYSQAENDSKGQNPGLIKAPTRGYEAKDPNIPTILPKDEPKKGKTDSVSKQKAKKAKKNSPPAKVGSKPMVQPENAVKTHFDKLRADLSKSIELKIKQIREEGQKELEKLNQIETFVMEQLSKAESTPDSIEASSMRSQPVDFRDDVSVESDRFSSVSSKDLTNRSAQSEVSINNDHQLLINSYKDKTFISLDLIKSQRAELPVLPNGSSRLFLPPDRVLIYNSVTQEVSSVHLISGDLKVVARFNSNRRFCIFGFINSFPAVMGGIDSNSSRISREVDVIDRMNVPQKLSPLQHPRSHGLSTVHNRKTFVFGGNPPDVTKTIEMFNGETWNVLSLNMPMALSQFGVISVKDSIVVLGGVNNETKEKVNRIFAIDPVKNTIKYTGYISFNFLAGNCMNTLVKERTLYLIDYETGEIRKQSLPNF